jgi:demethylmenaquinone methyltransferase/2-methoxy-6-polyprenyl-1,4-benzoquinol methylase
MTQHQTDTTDFGFERVAWTEKASRVRGVFDSVASKYDLMNDLMSAGAHRLWKRFTLSCTNLRAGQRALDVAGGTGDLSIGMLKQVGPTEGFAANSRGVQANAECLPFKPAQFDCVTIGFGLRNVTDKMAALRSMKSMLRPGGQLIVLEFSQVAVPALKPLYDAYSFKVLPLMGRIVANDEASYRYLAESIRKHPDQETLLSMMREAGLENCSYQNLSGGIVAVHRGYVY